MAPFCLGIVSKGNRKSYPGFLFDRVWKEGNSMELTSSYKEKVEHQFDTLVKKVLLVRLRMPKRKSQSVKGEKLLFQRWAIGLWTAYVPTMNTKAIISALR